MEFISSALGSVALRQEPPPMLIGERLNAQGSRRAKRLVLEGDIDGLVDIARDQVEGGAHCLDVCVATTERSDELEMMASLVKRLSLEVEAPLVIDSTDPAVVEEAVRRTPGLPMINSINLEGDGSRFSRLAPVMKKYGVPAVALCIGPDGMAKTPAQKLATARLLRGAGEERGLRGGQYVFDVLTFTLGTGEAEFADAGKSTLEGLRAVKGEFPDSFTTLGLSNVSFGLQPAARRALNSAFLYHAVEHGLDSAIVNPREITPYAQLGRADRDAAEKLIYNTSEGALAEFVARFEGGSEAAGAAAEKIDASLPPGRRANLRIVNRVRDGIELDVAAAVAERSSLPLSGGRPEAPAEATHEGAIAVLNEDLLPAMKEVGDKFGAGELILPFVLRSAECMKAAVSELERYLVKEKGSTKGRLVLGTVYGDVHDIGKNLVKTIFENNGYTVYDLGKQVPVQKFADKIAEVGADAVGLSALLVSTSKQMEEFVDRARLDGMGVPVLCGGAAINSSYIYRIAKKGGVYEPGVFYCKTMFEGLRTMDALVSGGRGELMRAWRQRLEAWKPAPARPAPEKLPRSSVRPAEPPAAPRLAEPVRLGPEDIDMGQVWELMDEKALIKMSWGVQGRAGASQQAPHEQIFREWKGRVINEGLLEPSAVYCHFACSARGQVLSVKGPGGDVDFEFPRSAQPRHLCLADYFGADDIVAFQAVTAGRRVSDLVGEWNERGMYADAYYLHGIGVQFAEAMAEWVHRKIRSEWGRRGGLRYSWGYASCPDVAQHELVWKLLRPEKSGMELTGAGQIVPEQSTAAVVVHHPEATYFSL